MTCCIAARYDDGVLIATDSCVSAGDERYQLQDIKAFEWRGLIVAYAGALHYVQGLSRKPSLGYTKGVVASFQQLVWDFPTARGDLDETEFIVVDDVNDIHVVSGRGDVIGCRDYAVVGSGLGWVGLDLEYPRVRKKTLNAVKRCAARVLRAAAKRDNTVSEPFRYWELED